MILPPSFSLAVSIGVSISPNLSSFVTDSLKFDSASLFLTRMRICPFMTGAITALHSFLLFSSFQQHSLLYSISLSLAYLFIPCICSNLSGRYLSDFPPFSILWCDIWVLNSPSLPSVWRFSKTPAVAFRLLAVIICGSYCT